jgi:DNA-binding NarL/FixJ family response regulator
MDSRRDPARIDAGDSGVNRTTVLIAVAVRLYREGLEMTLAADPTVSILGTAESAREALERAGRTHPNVILLDSSLEGALDLVRAVRESSSTMRTLVFAVREEISAILSFAEAGADGFVTANGTMSELVAAIRSARAGDLPCSPSVAAQLLRHAASQAGRGLGASGGSAVTLTGRESQVLSLLREGRSNKEIAIGLSIAEATVKNHVHHLLEKLRVTTRAKAAAAMLGRPSRSRQAG